MEYQKVINLLDNASNQPSKFKTKDRVEINDQSREVYNANSDIAKVWFIDYSDNYSVYSV